MADIKQAAKWMDEGKRVKRREWKAVYEAQDAIYMPVKWDQHDAPFSIQDLLADDWEIAE